MKLQKLLSHTRKAVEDYDMIQTGDKICVAISGGKDSLALLYALHGLKRFYKNPFEIIAITVKLGFEPFDLTGVSALCEKLGVEYHIIETQIGQIVFDERQESNPCSLCAKMRKGALNEAAEQLGCNKVALGHHKEDVVETVMMSQFFESRYYCFPPVTYMSRSNLYSIRPLIYCNEVDLVAFMKKNELPVVKSPCPANGNTKRESMKQLLLQQANIYPGLIERLFRALQRSEVEGWKLEE